MPEPDIPRLKGLRSHKEVFSQYLSEAPRWKGPTGEMKILDWQEWLSQEGIARCNVTGWYGEYGWRVIYQKDHSWPVLNHPKTLLYDLADNMGYDVSWNEMDGDEIVTLYKDGDKVYDFCDTFISKEQRVETYLKGKT